MEISNPDKVYFPGEGITKGEVVGYYVDVADVMLPYLAGRPLTLQRFPDGIGQKGFMQKNASKHFPKSIQRIEIPKSDGTTTYPVIDSTDDLVYLANQGTITFHIWTARLPDLQRPDRIILDLDPAEDAHAPRDAARAAREVLADAGLDSGLTTTGSSGYHVVAPIVPENGYDAVGTAARVLAEIVATRHPDRFTTEFQKKNRQGRVFVDWLRNRDAQSVAAPWSVRPLPGAPVVMPISWDELDDTEPGRWTIGDAPTRRDLPDIWPKPGTLDLETIERLGDIHGIEPMEPFDRFRD